MKKVIKAHALKYNIGLHPSWRSNRNENILRKEKRRIESIAEKQITDSRQHYIKFDLPHTFQRLISFGITDDYSMGYGTINGFRASTASSHNWFDLSNNKETTLRLHPFCFMDANCHYEQKLSTDDSYKELMYYYDCCKKNNATFIPVFHNNFLGEDKEFNGWKKIFSDFVSMLP